jgi:XTP/dITP diphosphohydrolase
VLAPAKLFLASSNPGKLAEFRELARTAATSSLVELELLPNFNSFPTFEENAPTFAENAVGKALQYSRLQDGLIFADDSGLVVPALNGQPGVHSARYAGPHATSADRMAKLVSAMRGKFGADRQAHFVCAIALAQRGRALAVITNRVDGEILEVPRGSAGFGYDPLFYFPPLHKTFAELLPEEKNQHSHRGKAFLRLLSSMLDNTKS